MSDNKRHQDEPHKHFICLSLTCGALFCAKEPQYAEMKDGDACPACLIATVKEARPAVVPPDLGKMGEQMDEQLKPLLDFMLTFTAEEKAFKDRTLVLREQTRDALRSIAYSLGVLTGAIVGDDQGHAALRITGEIVGGEGDVREPV